MLVPRPPAPGSRAGRGGGRPHKPIGKGASQNYFIEMNEQLMGESVPYLKTLTV